MAYPSLFFFIRMRTHGGDRSLANSRGIRQNVGEFAINFTEEKDDGLPVLNENVERI